MTIITSKQFKLGDIREDGFVFIGYVKKRGKIIEAWRDPTSYFHEKVKSTYIQAKLRAEAKGLPLDIDPEHLIQIYPEDNKCPVFGTEFCYGNDNSRNFSPSIDRIDPDRGYVKGNVVWVSLKANRAKNNLSLEELRNLLKFYESLEA